jgi:hypothetical protein
VTRVDLVAGKVTARSQAFAGSPSQLTLVKDRNLMVLAGSPTIHLVELASFKPLAQSYISKEGEWLTIAPEGFFAASAKGGGLLSLVRGTESISIQQAFRALYDPDLVHDKLAGDPDGDVRRAAAATNLEAVLASGDPPKLSWPHDLPADISAKGVLVRSVRVQALSGGSGRLEWRVNGLTVGVDAMARDKNSYERPLPLDPGVNIIEVAAYNAKNMLSSKPLTDTVEWKSSLTAAPGRLFVLAIGINAYDDPGYTDPATSIRTYAPPLSLAVSDAKSIGEAFGKAASRYYSAVEIKYALDADASRRGLDAIVEELSGRIEPSDSFVLYVAAHGRSELGHFYILPQDFRSGSNALTATGIGEAELQDWITNRIKAKKIVVLLDTCESGALVAGNRLEGATASEGTVGRLHEATGRPILTAAAAGKEALEGYKGSGVFTYAVLNALKTGDVNGDGLIELSELTASVQAEVPKITSGLEGASAVQTPRFGSRGEDFVISGRLN